MSLYYINSANRISGSNSDFTYNLKTFKEEHDRVCVLQASIPKSYYVIAEPFNTFTLTEGIDEATITLPEGNYNLKSIKIITQSLLNTGSPNGYTYTLSTNNPNIQQDTGKITFSVADNGAVQPSFTFGDNPLGEKFGFDKSSTNSFTGDALVSSNVVNLQKESTLFIRSNICNNSIDNTLQDIYAALSNDYSVITFQNVSPFYYSKELNRNNTSPTFTLTDEDGNLIDLKGLSFQITLLTFSSKEVPTKQKMKLKSDLIQSMLSI